jgi:hypothetical protein|tara:strand:+ start:100 stop:282 length:183 start_codon:yes stop_codon:yes gene_type:complete
MKFRDVTPLDILEMLERRINDENISYEDKQSIQEEIAELQLMLKEIYTEDFDERLIETCD